MNCLSRNLLGSVLALFGIVLFLGSCRDSGEEPVNKRPFQGESVQVLTPDTLAADTTWQLILDEWSEQTGAEAELQEVSMKAGQMPAADPPPVDSMRGGRVVFFPVVDASDYLAQGWVAPFPVERLRGTLDWGDLFRGLRERVATLGSEAALLPISCPTLVCYYREDLLEAARRKPPTTWDEYRDLVEAVDDWAPGLVVMEPWSVEFRATLFLAKAVAYAQHPGNYSLYFDIFTGEPLIDGPGFVRALEESLETIARMPHSVLQATPADCRRAILEGRAALTITFEMEAAHTRTPFLSQKPAQKAVPTTKTVSEPAALARPQEARIGFCRLPGTQKVYNRSTQQWETPPDRSINRCTLTAFAGLAAGVSDSSSDDVQNAACHLLDTLTRQRLTTAFPGAAKSLCRNSQADAAPSWLGEELSVRERTRYVDVVAESLRNAAVVAELPVVGHRRFREALTEGLNRAVDREVSPAEALRQVRKTWSELIASIGAETVQDSYRQRLGLPPRPH